MSETFHLVRADAAIRDVYTVVPGLFHMAGVLIVTLDSDRRPAGKIGLLETRVGAVTRVGDAVWIPAGRDAALFASDDLIVHFDAMFLFCPPKAPPHAPRFNMTTDAGDAFEPGGASQSRLLEAMRDLQARAYLADGCGLAAVLADRAAAEAIAAALPGATLHAISH